MDNLDSEALAERYINRMYIDHPAVRWWAHSRILVGGSINNSDDFENMQNKFGVTSVISVESEHSDSGKVPEAILCHLPTPDDGSAPSVQHWKTLIDFAQVALKDSSSKVYVHCQMGGSRSPAAAYAIMRTVFNFNPNDALAHIQRFKTGYGEHWYHRNYLESVETALTS
jgi:hypothetical protein